MDQTQLAKAVANWIAQYEKEANSLRMQALRIQKKGLADEGMGRIIDCLGGQASPSLDSVNVHRLNQTLL